MVSFRRILALALVAALMVVPAVGRAGQKVDPPNAKPRLAGSYRSIDVSPHSGLIAPDTSARPIVVRNESGAGRDGYQIDEAILPAAPVVSDREALRGPPPLHL
jgi:hypothetical protein